MDADFDLFDIEDDKTAEGRQKNRKAADFADGAEMTAEEFYFRTAQKSEIIKIVCMVLIFIATCVTMIFTIKLYVDYQNMNAEMIEILEDGFEQQNTGYVYNEQGSSAAVMNQDVAESISGDAMAVMTTSAVNNYLVNVNTADKETLMDLNGIGEVKAQAIIDYRGENGKFKSVDELLKVPGIGEKTLAKFRDEVTVG